MTHLVPGRSRRRGPHLAARLRLSAAVALVATLVAPGLVAAHPLGNFTINHYAGIRIEADRILLDVVIDQAEIPAFQARLALDLDGDGELSPSETAAGRLDACTELSGSLDLRAADSPLALLLTHVGLSFPPGAGGLSTMRLVCGYEATLPEPLRPGTTVSFADRSFDERLGWRELVVEGSGVTLSGVDDLRTTSVSDRLTSYPEDKLTQALTDAEIQVVVRPGGPGPGGPRLPAFDIPDAVPVGAAERVPSTSVTVNGPSAAVPGGVDAADLPPIFRTADLTPLVLLVSILTAAALGAGHALTPGHGKTLMAAYLVGTRGTAVHAAGLGLSVALSHTLGILALAGLVVGAQGLLPPELVVRTAPLIAAASIVVIGGWMLVGEIRRRRSRTSAFTGAHVHEGQDDVAHDHHGHGHGHGRGQHGQHGHGRGHGRDENDDRKREHEHDRALSGEHGHGGLRHTHLLARGSRISWRSLFVLGLAGGIIPSASALLILLGSIAAGRPAFGFVLVVAFGLGMATVMSGIGVALVVARGRLDRVDASSWLGRASTHLPLLASCLVLGFGVILTVQAVTAGNIL